jgi:hypothetical protein
MTPFQVPQKGSFARNAPRNKEDDTGFSKLKPYLEHRSFSFFEINSIVIDELFFRC